MKRILILLAILAIFLSSSAFAGVTGKIAGRVIDKDTGKPLPGANVIILGTGLGAATDKNGEYYIIQVPPGNYSVKVSMMGYRPVVVEKVHVTIDLTTRLDFALEPTVIEVPGITVIAKRPLIQHDITSSVRYATREDMGYIPDAESFDDIVRLQPGVVAGHIRGGRSGEVLYTIDGIPIRHPIYGGTAAFGLNIISIKEMEMLTGGFNAEYGQAQSGVVNIVTREGGDKLSGEIEYKSDNYGPKSSSFNTDYSAFSVGGPEPISSKLLPYIGISLPGKVRFFISGSANLTDTYLYNRRTRNEYNLLGIKFHDRQSNQFNGNAKLTYNITPKYKLSLGYIRGWRWYSWFDWPWVKNLPDSTQDAYSNSDQTTLSFTHTVSSNTFYTLRVGRLKTEYKSNLRGKTPPEYYEWDIDTTWVIDTTVTPPESTAVIDSINKGGTPWGWDLDRDGFVDVGAHQRWREDLSYVWTGKLDLTSQVNPRHLIKFGVEANYNDVSFVDLQYVGYFYYPGRDTVPGPYKEYGLYRWVFDGYPWSGAVYLRDKMEFKGLIVNAGLRLDYFDPGPTVEDSAYLRQWHAITELPPLKVKRHRYILSPRLGISHPITERTVMYFAYGHFTQMPDLIYLYRDPWTGTWVGNPNLQPQKTVEYEFGFSQQLTADAAAYIKWFSRDNYDYVGLIQTGTPPVWVWVNKGYGRTRGIELQLKKRYSNFTSGNFAYTYQWATGYASWAYMECYRIWGGGQIPIREHRLDWDQRHTIVLNFNLMAPKGEKLLGILPDRWGMNLLWRFGSGLPYTPAGRDISIMENMGTCPFTSTFDVTLYKEFAFGKRNFRIFANILNLFDRKNVRKWDGFNTWTGLPYRYGDADGATHRIYSWREMQYLMHPARFESGRQIKLGIRLHW